MAAGATAISRCAPTNPHASISQTLGELRRDGIPAIPLIRSLKKGPRPPSRKDIGNEYLNVEFGWKPLISDVGKLISAQRESEKLVKQYLKDAKRLIRRRYDFPVSTSVVHEELGPVSPVPALVSAHYVVSKGKLTRETRVEKRMWFSGAFTYAVGGQEDAVAKLRRNVQVANHIYGAGITPSVIWDLAPWSWAADWVTNTGDIVNNASAMALDGLVVVYGYIMAQTVTTVTYRNVGCTLTNGPAGIQPPMTLTQSWTQTIRQRRRATPFGFGLELGAFTPRQLAIVAALGLSRDGRKLAI